MSLNLPSLGVNILYMYNTIAFSTIPNFALKVGFVHMHIQNGGKTGYGGAARLRPDLKGKSGVFNYLR